MNDEYENIPGRHRFSGLTEQQWNIPLVIVLVGCAGLWAAAIVLIAWAVSS